jgi:hypothetical protein
VYLDGRFVGNVSALDIAITEERLEQTDYTSAGGGNCAVVRRVDSVELSMTMTSYDADNLALAVFGEATPDVAGTVTDEAQTTPATLDEDTLVVTDKIIDITGTTTVTSDPAGTTYVEGTDYTVGGAGITVLAAGSIGAGTSILISYDNVGVDVVQALVTSAQVYEFTFDGINEADEGNPLVVKAYRVQFGPTEGLPLIADDFAELPLTGDILLDSTKTGTGISQYFTISTQG